MAKAYLLILFFATAGKYHMVSNDRVYEERASCVWNGEAWKKELEKTPGNGQIMYYCASFDNVHGV